jgi:hypothetical protein
MAAGAVDCRAVACNRLVEWNDLDARALRLTLALDWLVVDRIPAIPARIHSRTMRRTAMMPPWPVSPSMITGIDTLSAIHPAMVTHSVMVAVPTSESPVYAPTTPPVPTNNASQPPFCIIRACAAVGGCKTANTLSRRWIRVWRFADFEGFSLMIVRPSTESLSDKEYRRLYLCSPKGRSCRDPLS